MLDVTKRIIVGHVCCGIFIVGLETVLRPSCFAKDTTILCIFAVTHMCKLCANNLLIGLKAGRKIY